MKSLNAGAMDSKALFAAEQIQPIGAKAVAMPFPELLIHVTEPSNQESFR